MISIEEGHLRFEFDPNTWDHVEKWDDTPQFQDGIGVVEGVDAIDIIAYSSARKECLLLEAKDFRDQNDAAATEQNSKKRSKKRDDRGSPTEGQVAAKRTMEVAQKVAGTVAGLAATSRVDGAAFASSMSKALVAHKSEGYKVRVVFWIEGQPTSKGLSPRSKVNLSTLMGVLKKKLTWLTSRPVQVLSTDSPADAVPGLTVVDCR